MNLAVLAAWLHDIGKFAQRAKERRSSLEHEYCPNRNGYPSHQHVLYTDYFIEHILPLPEELEASRSLIASLAASHHRADEKSREHRAIQLADRLSSGMDRTESEEEGNYIAERMDAIFSKLRLNGKGHDEKLPVLKYELKPLNDASAIFPSENAGNGPDYQPLWRDFLSQLEKLPCRLGFRAWMSSLVSVLERYCWCIPSATWKSLPDVSLYDHSATTAAITQAILACPEGKEKFLLFGGDLSGIQTFIFGREEPADKGATRLLRARSFLLQTVTRSIWLSLLERLKLDEAAKIMDSGGRFVLLLPAGAEIESRLEQFECDVEKWLFEKFQGAVRINFASRHLSRDDFKKERFAAAFKEFGDLLEEAKLHPFHHLFATGQSPVFPVNYSDYGEFGECSFCHTRAAVKEDDGQASCAQCSLLKNIGKILPKTRFIIFALGRGAAKNSFSDLLFDRMSLSLCEAMPTEAETRHALQILSIQDELVFTVSPVAGHVPLISAKDIERWRKAAWPGCEINSPSEENCEEGDLKTFSMLAQEARIPPATPDGNWTSIPCLGICKADVDNLGLVFSLGLADSFSLSCYAMLARMLNYFFAAYLMRVIREQFPNIYVVFAGGDDVFVIGPWPETIDFSLRMARDFVDFCAANPAISISAGLPLVKAGLPMRAMKEEAESLLEASKNFQNGSKNALTLFGVSAHWQQAEELLDAGKWLGLLCEKEKISRTFLRRLLGYSRECGEFIKGKQLAKNGLYLSHFKYDLARNYKRTEAAGAAGKPEQETASDFARLQALPVNQSFFSRLEMGISWAIYRTRIS